MGTLRTAVFLITIRAGEGGWHGRVARYRVICETVSLQQSRGGRRFAFRSSVNFRHSFGRDSGIFDRRKPAKAMCKGGSRYSRASKLPYSLARLSATGISACSGTRRAAGAGRLHESIVRRLTRTAEDDRHSNLIYQRLSAFEMESGPLPTRMLGGARIDEIRVIASTACSPLMLWSTSIANASRDQIEHGQHPQPPVIEERV